MRDINEHQLQLRGHCKEVMADDSKFTAYLVAAVLVVIFLLRQRPKVDPNGGPTVVPPLIPIPYLGHVLGLFWYRTAYYSKVRQVQYLERQLVSPPIL